MCRSFLFYTRLYQGGTTRNNGCFTEKFTTEITKPCIGYCGQRAGGCARSKIGSNIKKNRNNSDKQVFGRENRVKYSREPAPEERWCSLCRKNN
jgi:hypothetical protein